MVEWTGYANRMRVGKEWSASRQPTQADPSYPVTARVYQATNYEFYNYDGTVNWSGSFGSGSHTGRLSNSNTYHHATLYQTFTASYDTVQWFTLSISGSGTSAGPASGTWTGAVPRRPTGDPTAPRNLKAVANSYDSVTLTWDAPSDMKGTSLSKYEVWTDNTNHGSNGTSRTRTITGLTGNTTYTFRVRAFGSGWDATRSGAYASVTLTTPQAVPNTPAAPVVSAVTSTTAQVKMGTPTTPGLPVIDTGAWIYDAASGGTVVWSDGVPDLTTQWVATGLPRATDLWAEVAASNDAGWSSHSPRTKFTTLPDLPTQPKNYTLRDITANTAYTTNVFVDDNGGEALTDIRVQWNTTPSEVGATTATMGSWTDALLEGLVAGVTYTYRVAVANRAGWSPWGEWVVFTTNRYVPNRPGAPSIDWFEIPSVILSWPEAVPNSAEVTGYQLQVSSSKSFSTLMYESYTDKLNALVTGTQAGVQYYARVRASSAAGFSAWSPISPVPPIASTGVKAWMRLGGTWRQGTLWLKVAGAWRTTDVRLRAGGSWRTN